MVKADCPNLNALQALLDETGAEECKDFLGHLESCTRCQNALETLVGEMEAWRFAAVGLGQPVRYEPALLDLMDRLKDEDFFGADDDNFSFLQPADKAGLLGLLGDYEIQEQIGRGGMGIVLKATDPSLNRTVAIKVLTPRLATSVTARRRFVRKGALPPKSFTITSSPSTEFKKRTDFRISSCSMSKANHSRNASIAKARWSCSRLSASPNRRPPVWLPPTPRA